MDSERAHLSSIATTLDELTERVTESANGLDREHADVAADLYEVERSLRAAARRLSSVVRHYPA